MGVASIIRLTPQVELRNVVEALGILLGEPWKWEPRHRWVEVENCKATGCVTMPEFANIRIGSDPIKLGWLYHFEGENGNWRLMLPSSTARNIVLGRALVSLFGGEICYQDYNDKAKFKRPVPAWLKGKYSDQKFEAKHQALSKLKPITKEQIAAMEKYAAYH